MTSVFDDPEKIKDDPETEKIIREFTEALKKERMAKGVSQIKMGDKSGITQKAISFVEGGNNFKMDTYVKLCRAIGLTPEIKFRRRAKKKSSGQHTAADLKND